MKSQNSVFTEQVQKLHKFVCIILISLIYSCSLHAREVIIASGRLDGAYIQKASEMCESYRSYGLSCRPLITSGSSENIALLRSGIATNAIVQEDAINKNNDEYRIIGDEALLIITSSNVETHELAKVLQLKTVIDRNSGVKVTMDNVAKSLDLKLHVIGDNVLDAETMLCNGEIGYLPVVMSLPSKKIDLLLSKCDVYIYNFNDIALNSIIKDNKKYFKYHYNDSLYLGIKTLFI